MLLPVGQHPRRSRPPGHRDRSQPGRDGAPARPDRRRSPPSGRAIRVSEPAVSARRRPRRAADVRTERGRPRPPGPRRLPPSRARPPHPHRRRRQPRARRSAARAPRQTSAASLAAVGIPASPRTSSLRVAAAPALPRRGIARHGRSTAKTARHPLQLTARGECLAAPRSQRERPAAPAAAREASTRTTPSPRRAGAAAALIDHGRREPLGAATRRVIARGRPGRGRIVNVPIGDATRGQLATPDGAARPLRWARPVR